MSAFVAALPMYDWPEAAAETDAEWTALREALRAAGIAAPDRLARRNADLPAVPGGIMNGAGDRIAPDPATLPPDGLDLDALWKHPRLLLAQTCWGPMEAGLAAHVRVVAQPDYSAYEGGEGVLYSSALLARRGSAAGVRRDVPGEASACIPVPLLRGGRYAFNSADSMSGMLALARDLQLRGASMGIFRETVETGSHRASIVAVADGRADFCAVDCRTLALARRFEPAAAELVVVGWTARRKGLPYVASAALPAPLVERMRAALAGAARG